MTEKTMNAYDTNNFQNMHTENEIYEHFSRNNDRYLEISKGDFDDYSEMSEKRSRRYSLIKSAITYTTGIALSASLAVGGLNLGTTVGYTFGGYDVVNAEKVENSYELTYRDNQKETYTMEELAEMVDSSFGSLADVGTEKHDMPDGHTVLIHSVRDNRIGTVVSALGVIGSITVASKFLSSLFSDEKAYSKRRFK